MILVSFHDLPHLSHKFHTSSFYFFQTEASIIPSCGPRLEDEMPCVVDSAAKSTKQYTVRIHPVSSLQMPSKNTL